MSEEQQTPEEQSVGEKFAERLREWGIDLDTFQKKIQAEGEEAREDFNKLVGEMQDNMQASQEKMDEQAEKMQAEMEEFGERMSKAWDSMVAGFRNAMNDLQEKPETAEPVAPAATTEEAKTDDPAE